MPQNDDKSTAFSWNRTAAKMFEHGSIWLAEPQALQGIIGAVRAGVMQKSSGEQFSSATFANPGGSRGVIAVINVEGMIQKGDGWFGTSTQTVRSLLKIAAADPEVEAVMLVIDSPGGYVAGVKELADDIRRVDREVKPVVAYIEDLGASAAYWIASQARMVLANDMAEVGSIGVYTVIADTSKMYEDAGVKVKVVSSGGLKGAFSDGAPVTDEMVADLQDRIAQVAAKFVESVKAGRRKPEKTVQAWADGRVHLAAKALDMGMIDGVVSNREEALSMSVRSVKEQKSKRKAEEVIRRFDAMTAETGMKSGTETEKAASLK